MVECPECGEELTYLISAEQVWVGYETRLMNGALDYSTEHKIIDTIDDQPWEFSCPYCNNVIVKGEEEALKFLKGVEK